MNVYMYQAEFLCIDCGETIKLHHAKTPENPDDESTFDSDDYPKGPYPDGGGEADSPWHCGNCQVFLENPLTTDGEEYVKESIEQSPQNPAVACWREFYSYLWD